MFAGATAGGFQPRPTTGNIAAGGDSGGGGGSGLSESEAQAIMKTSLAGAVQPSSVTTAGAVKSSTAFSFDVGDDGEDSKIERGENGGLVLKRGGLNFLTLSPPTGASFGVNLTASASLTVNGTFTASQGIARVYSSAAVDNLLAAEQATVTTGSLAISDVASLQTSLDAKQSLLNDRDGNGLMLRDGTAFRQISGDNGIAVVVSFQHRRRYRSRKLPTEGGWIGAADRNRSQAERADSH